MKESAVFSSALETTLIVAAHPDDEILGCGATACRMAAQGVNVDILILGEGAASRGGEDVKPQQERLREQAWQAADVIGARSVHFGGLADNRFDGHDLLDIAKSVESMIGEVRPDVVLTHHGGDLNVDHQLTHRAVVTATRPIAGTVGGEVKGVYAFEVPSATEWAFDAGRAFAPTEFVDVSETLATKIEALQAYTGEMRDFPHPRSTDLVEALAKTRGAQAGMRRAEAFTCIRALW